MSTKVEILALFDNTANTLKVYQEQKDEIINLLRKGRFATSNFWALRAYLFYKAAEIIKSENAIKTLAG